MFLTICMMFDGHLPLSVSVNKKSQNLTAQNVHFVMNNVVFLFLWHTVCFYIRLCVDIKLFWYKACTITPSHILNALFSEVFAVLQCFNKFKLSAIPKTGCISWRYKMLSAFRRDKNPFHVSVSSKLPSSIPRVVQTFQRFLPMLGNLLVCLYAFYRLQTWTRIQL